MPAITMPAITRLPPEIQYLLASVSSTLALLATQGLISNRTEKLVSGLAAIELPIAYLLLAALWRLARARETAARINAGQPTTRLTP